MRKSKLVSIFLVITIFCSLFVTAATVSAYSGKYIEVTKTLPAKDIDWSAGAPSFVYKLANLGDSTGNSDLAKTITFTKEAVKENTNTDGIVMLKTVFEDLENANYALTETSPELYKTSEVVDIVEGTASNSHWEEVDGQYVEVFEFEIQYNLSKTQHGAATFVGQAVTPPAPPTTIISKVDIAGNELPGAEISLKYFTKENIANPEVAKWISTNKPHTLSLNPGIYIFHEETAPSGYLAVTDIAFSVDIDGTVKVVKANGNKVVATGNTLTVTDKAVPEEPLRTLISKVDLNGNELAGAEILIKTIDGTEITKWISTDKPHELSLEPGEYIFHEEAAPKGYLAVTDITFTVDKNGNVTIKNADGNTVQVIDNTLIVTDKFETPTPEEPTPEQPPTTSTTIISKVDIGGNELPGADISIKSIDGVEIERWVSTTTPHEISLAPGEYIFHEEAAPTGYLTVTDITFMIDENGNVTVSDSGENTVQAVGNTMIVTDYLEPSVPEDPQPVPTVISKVDIGGNELPGASISITTKDGKEIDKWVSTIVPHKLVLDPGEYIFHEESAPAGFLAVSDITFSVDKKGNVKLLDIGDNIVYALNNVMAVVDLNEPTTTIISKVDITGKELPGAEIFIKTIDGIEIAKWTSTDKPYELSLRTGEYVFHEEVAPTGYMAVTDITFIVDKDGNVTVTNANGNSVQTKNNHLIVTDQLVPKTPETPNAPNTGDDTSVVEWIIVAVVSVLCIGYFGVKYKKNRKKSKKNTGDEK